MIYLDTSVALATLLNEDLRPPDELWQPPLISSRLIEYELWVRLNARSLGETHTEAANHLVSRIALLELVEPVVRRAREPFPIELRTLDALHLASIEFLRAQGTTVRLATYDRRQRSCAEALGIELYPLDMPA